MTNKQWEQLLAVTRGERLYPPPVGFIIDSPWLPNWAGMTLEQYYSSGKAWLDANLTAVRTFPEVLFLPGFWAEFGMCTEPSAFGARCVFSENDFPFAERIFEGDPMSGDLTGFDRVKPPIAGVSGLTANIIAGLKECRSAIRHAGHDIRFAVARGPLNIAGFLMGNTEFLLSMKMRPDEVHGLLKTISDFLVDWLMVQAQAFDKVDGIFLLDDVVGFCGEEDFLEFAKPYLKRAFSAIDASVRFFHNDAPGLVCAPHLADIGVNLFNFSHEHSITEMRRLAGPAVALLGNIPPRDVLAQGTPEDVRRHVAALVEETKEMPGVILSCGGGMPPGVPTDNILAFLDAAAGP